MTTKQTAINQDATNQAMENFLLMTLVSLYTAKAWNLSMAIPRTDRKLVTIGTTNKL